MDLFLYHRRTTRTDQYLPSTRTLTAKTSCRCTKQPKLPYSNRGVHPVVRRNLAPQRKILTPQYCNMTLEAPGYVTGAPTRVRTTMGLRLARTCLLVPPSRMTIRSRQKFHAGSWI